MELLLLKIAPEIFLKGLNRGSFERRLKKNIENVLEGESYTFLTDQNRWLIRAENLNPIKEKVKRVFGISEVVVVRETERDLEYIEALVLEFMKLQPSGATFKVETKRADKNFPIHSMDLSRKLGGHILTHLPGFSVQIKDPDVVVQVEIREKAYVYFSREEGIHGMPYGVNGSTMLMLSGGIDSPVAGFLMAKRGIEVHGVYYHSHPYTSERAKDKVKELARILKSYTGKFHLHVVPFTEIQMEIMDKCPEDELTILMRRFMMRCAVELAQRLGIQSVTTGESIGQVASQTMEALVVSDACADRPVFRPLVAMDKTDIMDIAKRIGTFETSILPYEDCCTIFVPKHPVTKPRRYIIENHEAALPIEELVTRAVDEAEVIVL